MSILEAMVRRTSEAAIWGRQPERQHANKGGPMRVMVIVKASKKSEAGALPDTQLLADMGAFNDQLVKAGVMLAGDGLKPRSTGKRIKFSNSKKTVVDGPFAETKELVAGFWIWQVRSMDE